MQLLTHDLHLHRTLYKLEKSFSEPEPKALAETARNKIEEFRVHVPMIMMLGNPGMKPRHWAQVSEIVGFTIKYDADLTLGKVLGMNLEEYIGQFEPISEAAAKEATLEKGIDRMETDWQKMSFTVHSYKETKTYVVASIDDIQLMLEDHITKVMTMKNSAHIGPFEAQIL